MSSSITLDLCFGIQITDENICGFPWSKIIETDIDAFYDPDHSFIDDFENWKSENCPLDVEIWGDHHWDSQNYYVLIVKGASQSTWDDILVPDWKRMEAQTWKLAEAQRWAVENKIDFSKAEWMIVPSYG